MPAVAELNLETLRPPGSSDDLVCVGYRPVFKEHVNRKGQKIGQRELSRITNRCNDRILDTNDFSPLAVRHTKDDSSFDPEVIGFVGPYRMGKVGNRHPLPAIEGKVWVYRDQLATLKKYPRLSVEFWADEDDPGNGYFDPISLLGAETPELDLGVHYSKDHEGRKLMRYSKVERFQAVYPGGANTSVPGLVGEERAEDRDDDGDVTKQQNFSKESGGMLTAQDIQQIVAAIKPIVTQQVDEAMAGMKAAMSGDEMPAEGGDADDLDLDADTDLDLGDDLDGMDDEQPDEDGDDLDLDGDGDDDLPPEIDDEMPDDESDETEQADGDGADSANSPIPEAAPEAEEEDGMAEDPKGKKKPAQYGKMTLEQYAKENRELREKYEKQTIDLRTANDKMAGLETRLQVIEGDKVRAVRYSKLTELRTTGYVLDVDQELTDAKEMNDEQFERHCTKIIERYQRAPIGHSLPIPASPKHDGHPETEKRTRYSKVAREVCLELSKSGKTPDYGTVLANVERNNGEYKPAA